MTTFSKYNPFQGIRQITDTNYSKAYIRNNSGPRKDPWEAAHLTVFQNNTIQHIVE